MISLAWPLVALVAVSYAFAWAWRWADARMQVAKLREEMLTNRNAIAGELAKATQEQAAARRQFEKRMDDWERANLPHDLR